MEWYRILVTAFFSFPIAFTVILEGPKSATYPEGTNVTLQCIARGSNRIVWEDFKENTVVFIDKRKNTLKTKFDNFFISDTVENYSLTIVHAQLSDEGLYSCEEGDDSRNANVTIEAGPDLYLFVNNKLLVPEDGITLTEEDQVTVICKAEGAKPAVHLTFKFGENEWIETNNFATSDDGLRFTTNATVIHSVSRDDTTVTCKATGLISIPPSSAEIPINVLHKPVCHVELERNIAECQCVSNPQVSGYKWYVNGTLQGTELLLPIHDHVPANLTCLATNAVGTGASASRYVPSTNGDGATSAFNIIVVFAILAFACVITVCSLIFCCLYKRRKKQQKFYDAVERFELDGGQSSVKLADDGTLTDKDTQGDDLEPEEKETLQDSGDNQPLVDPSSGNKEDEKEEFFLASEDNNTTYDPWGVKTESERNSRVIDNGNKNDAVERFELDGGQSSVKPADDGTLTDKDTQGDNLEPEEKETLQDSGDNQRLVDPSSGNKEDEKEKFFLASEDNNTTYDPWGVKTESERNSRVIDNGNKNDDTESTDVNVPDNATKKSEQAST